MFAKLFGGATGFKELIGTWFDPAQNKVLKMADSLNYIGKALSLLGNADASTSMGAIEAHGKAIIGVGRQIVEAYLLPDEAALVDAYVARLNAEQPLEAGRWSRESVLESWLEMAIQKRAKAVREKK